MNRKSLITGTTTLLGLIVGLFTHKILLGVAIGLAIGTVIAYYTNWFK